MKYIKLILRYHYNCELSNEKCLSLALEDIKNKKLISICYNCKSVYDYLRLHEVICPECGGYILHMHELVGLGF